MLLKKNAQHTGRGNCQYHPGRDCECLRVKPAGQEQSAAGRSFALVVSRERQRDPRGHNNISTDRSDRDLDRNRKDVKRPMAKTRGDCQTSTDTHDEHELHRTLGGAPVPLRTRICRPAKLLRSCRRL